MDTNFVFPRPAPSILRPQRPPSPGRANSNPKPTTEPAANRDSNALRASVLDAALLLGVGTNGTVADWIFNNPVEEGDEEEDTSVLFTSSSSTSPPTSPYAPPTPSSSSHSHSSHLIYNPPTSHEQNAYAPPSAYSMPPHALKKAPVPFPVSLPPITIPVPNSAAKVGGHLTPNKLKKKRDGYESDGGYISDAGRGRRRKDQARERKDSAVAARRAIDNNFERPEEKSFFDPESPPNSGLAKSTKKQKKGDKEEGQEERKRKKSFLSTKIGSKKPPTPLPIPAIPTLDSPTDDISATSDDKKVKPKSSKSRFFRLGSKASKPDLHTGPSNLEQGTSGSVPARSSRSATVDEMVPLPIADRFASALSSSNSSPSLPISTTQYSGFSSLGDFLGPTDVASATLSQTQEQVHIPTPSVSSSSSDSASLSSSNHKRRGVTQFLGAEVGRAKVGVISPTSPGMAGPARPERPYPPTISLPLTHSRTPVPSAPASRTPSHNPSPLLIPSPHTGLLSRGPPSTRSSSPTIIPSSSYLVPSPLPSPSTAIPRALSPGLMAHALIGPASPVSPTSPAPHVLAYYDIPPPRAPPTTPLPRVPAPQRNNSDASSNNSIRKAGKHPIINPARPTMTNGHSSPAQRGRVSPFPTKPTRPLVPRDPPPPAPAEFAYPTPMTYGMESAVSGYASEEDADVEQAQLWDVLERFDADRVRGRMGPSAGAVEGAAIGRRRSGSMLAAARARVPEPTRGELDVPEDESRARDSARWSGSVYSRASFLDGAASGDARGRFVERVGEMGRIASADYDDDEDDDEYPPRADTLRRPQPIVQDRF